MDWRQNQICGINWSDAKDALDNGATTEAQRTFLSEVHKELAITDWDKESFKLRILLQESFQQNGSYT